ncbi:hypothetical protein PIB30_025298 [Stylosanthes scabra]|uniref:Uncharacterized protein n=1 Tax=Stylosanthes scabra TaxID=79078 RepID=A0ABU6VC96_9FABA|nr:hypothetical protein [Stylosanthes scabra]
MGRGHPLPSLSPFIFLPSFLGVSMASSIFILPKRQNLAAAPYHHGHSLKSSTSSPSTDHAGAGGLTSPRVPSSSRHLLLRGIAASPNLLPLSQQLSLAACSVILASSTRRCACCRRRSGSHAWSASPSRSPVIAAEIVASHRRVSLPLAQSSRLRLSS